MISRGEVGLIVAGVTSGALSAESYGIQVLFYVITVPSQMSSNLIEILETKVDTKDKINNIAQYNTASTISKYLIKFESFLKETTNNEIKSDAKIYQVLIFQETNYDQVGRPKARSTNLVR